MIEVDFVDREGCPGGLNGLSVEMLCAISTRAALRVCATLGWLEEADFQKAALACFRATLTPAVRSLGRPADVRWLEGAALSAHRAVRSAGQAVRPAAAPRDSNSSAHAGHSAAVSALSTARYAANFAVDPDAKPDYNSTSYAYHPDEANADANYAARSTATAVYSSGYAADADTADDTYRQTRSAAFNAGSFDAEQDTLTEHHLSLWAGAKAPPSIEKAHRIFLDRLDRDRDTWGFWKRWYLSMWEGTFRDWDLATEVAKIPDDVWEQGAAAVATEITSLEALALSKKLPQAERILFDEVTAKFKVEPIPVAKIGLLGATITQVKDALEDVLASSTNGLHERSREVRNITRTLTKYVNDPQQIEMSFVNAHAGLTRQILVEELPASEENIALQQALEEAAMGIRATHSDIAENRKILSQQRFSEMSAEQKNVLKDALPILKAISDDALTNDWDHDVPALINTSIGPLPSGAPQLPGANEATRVFSRAAKISLAMKAGNVIRAIDNSAIYKAAGIVRTISALVVLGLALLALI